MNFYPAFLNLKKRRAVVVGGGKVAERKIMELLGAGADVTVISPALTRRLQREVDAGRLRYKPRKYRQGDLKDSFLVIAATDSSEVNTKIAKEAPCLLNVVDVPAECNFIAPSVIRRGELVLAISTGGISPAFAKAVRQDLEKKFDENISEYLDFVKELRTRVLTEIPDQKKREKFLKSLASRKILEALHSNHLDSVKQAIMTNFRKLSGK